MSNVVGEVAIDVTADIGPLVREGKKAEAALGGMERATQRLGRGMQNFGNATKDLGAKLSVVSAGIAAAAGSAFLLANNVATAGDEAAKAARSAGVSGEYFQELAYAMGQVTDLTQEELTKGLQRLNRTLGEAAQGSQTAIDAFAAIGITQDQIASGAVTTEMAMDRLISTLSDAQDPAIAAAIANDLLGRTGAKLGGQLAGAEDAMTSLRQRAHELGVVMDGDALAASEAFNDGMDDLMRGFQGLQIKIANELLPVFVNKLIPMMVEKVIPALGQVAEKVADMIEWFGGLPGPVQDAALIIGGVLGVGGPILVGVGLVATAIGGLVAAAGPIGLLIAAAGILAAAWYTWGDDIKAAVGTAIDYVTERFNAFLAFIQAIPAKMKEIGANIINGLLQGINEKWEELKARIVELAMQLPEWIRGPLGIESPSRVFAEIGGFIGQGLAEGIAASTDAVRSSIANISGQAVGEADGMVTGILGAASQLFAGSKKIALAQAAVNVAQGITEALKLPFPANLAAAAKVAVAGAAQLAQIRSANPGSGAVAGGTAGASGGAAAAPRVAQPQPVTEIVFGGTSSFERAFWEMVKPQLVPVLNQAVRDGARVFR
jgi:hypothetical protein